MDWDKIAKFFVNLYYSLPSFEVKLYILFGAIGLILLINGVLFLLRTRKKKAEPASAPVPAPVPATAGVEATATKVVEPKEGELPVEPKAKNRVPRPLLQTLQIISNAVLIPLAVAWLALTFVVRPFVASSLPAEGKHMSSAQQEIVIEFDTAVNPRNIKFNISPETKGKWTFEDPMPVLGFVRKARFTPSVSIFPDQRVVVYVTGVKQWWMWGEGHEISVEFFSPKTPIIVETNPSKNGRNVPTKADIELHTDAPLGDFVKWDFELKPEVPFKVVYSNLNKKITLELEEELIQDGAYSLKVYRTSRSYKVPSGGDLEVGETEEAANFKFFTVSTPLVKSWSPKGDGVLVSNPLKVVFADNMDKASVEANFKLTPTMTGKVSWTDDKTFVFTPDGGFKKETSYAVSFAKAMKNAYGGLTSKDIALKFKTIGKVAVSGFSPVSGSYNRDPKSTNIAVSFNQEVDHASAQAHFTISPKPAGSFAWKGNTMYYYTAGKLAYSTKYTVRITAGVKTKYGLNSNRSFAYSFTTRNQIFTLNIPYYHQGGTFNCNLAAARMALAYRRVYVSESQIKSWIGVGRNPNADWVDHYGVHAGPVAGFISRYRRTSVKYGWNIASLAREIEKGNPVIVWWYNRYSRPAGRFTLSGGYTGYKGMHSEVVRGFVGSSSSPVTFYTNDPWRGRLTYSASGFRSNWAYMGYVAIVVY